MTLIIIIYDNRCTDKSFRRRTPALIQIREQTILW